MPWVELEPTIPAFERAKTIHALDRADNVIGPIVKFGTEKIKVNFLFSVVWNIEAPYNLWFSSLLQNTPIGACKKKQDITETEWTYQLLLCADDTGGKHKPY
jgi:hypothetical protein